MVALLQIMAFHQGKAGFQYQHIFGDIFKRISGHSRGETKSVWSRATTPRPDPE
jgi:hypothetical protein